MRKSFSFISGILVGALLFGGTAAYAAGILAERSTCSFFLNGSPVEMEAYVINGNNYVKLRDVGALVDFGVSWSGENRAVMIDTMVSYTPDGSETAQQDKPAISTPAEGTREDFSQAANPAAFTGAYTRELYNAIGQTIADADAIIAGNDENGNNPGYTYAAIRADETVRTAMDEAAAAIGSWPVYSRKTAQDGVSTCRVKYPSAYVDAAAYCKSFIERISSLSEAEQVREISFFVCDRLTYDAASTSTPRTALASDGVHQGNCMSYAHNFKFLCDLAGIPCIFVHSEDHQWNQVYVGGQWWHVDVTGDDMENDPTVRDWITILHTDKDMQGYSYTQTQPALTLFAKELLVPGSTKE